MRETRRATTVALLLAVVLSVALAATACAGSSDDRAVTASSSTPSLATATAAGLRLTDGWATTSPAMTAMTMGGGSAAGTAVGTAVGTAAGTAAAYFTLTSTGPADSLVSVSSPDARSVALHTTTTRDGAEVMTRVRALRILAGASTTLQPDGSHLMVRGLPATVTVGDDVRLVLRFASGVSMSVTLPVIDPTDRPGQDPS